MITGAIGVVVLRNPFYSVLALVAHLISLAVLFLLLRAEFVAAVQVVVYAGAVMVLYVFVVAYVGGEGELDRRAPARRPGRSARALRLGGAIARRRAAGRAADRAARHGPGGDRAATAPVRARAADVRHARATSATLLLTRFLLAFELASFLLLIAAVGGVVLARRRGGLGEEDRARRALTPLDLLRPPRPGTGTMAEGGGERGSRCTS